MLKFKSCLNNKKVDEMKFAQMNRLEDNKIRKQK